jgi:hypothetical protein
MDALANNRKRLASAFLVLLGLNVLGVLCLAHCAFDTSFAKAAAAAKEETATSDCHRRSIEKNEDSSNKNTDESALGSGLQAIDNCCDLSAGVLSVAPRSSAEPGVPTELISAASPIYLRPPADRRIERKLNCIIRI